MEDLISVLKNIKPGYSIKKLRKLSEEKVKEQKEELAILLDINYSKIENTFNTLTFKPGLNTPFYIFQYGSIVIADSEIEACNHLKKIDYSNFEIRILSNGLRIINYGTSVYFILFEEDYNKKVEDAINNNIKLSDVKIRNCLFDQRNPVIVKKHFV
jgi:hypothetical protein